MVDRRDHVFRAQAYRGFRIIPDWVPGQFLIDTTVMLLVLDVLVSGWFYVVHFWDFLEDMPQAISEGRWPVDEAAVYSDVLGYAFKTSLFDIPCLALFRASVVITIWMKWPHISYPLIPLVSTIYLIVKACTFQYTIWVETSHSYYEFYQGDAVTLMVISCSFAVLESLVISAGNYKTRQDLKDREKFRVKKGRCPVCTLPVERCKHKVYMDKMKVYNAWNIGILECHKEPLETFKMCCCLWCPCAEGSVAMETTGYCCLSGCCYTFTALTCLPFGVHGMVGALNRWKLRKSSNIKGTLFRDWLEHWFCPCCALIQERNQIKYNQNPPQDNFRLTVEKEKIAAPITTEQMLRGEVEGIGNIAGGLTAGIAVREQLNLINEDKASKAYAKIREKQYMQDMKEVIADVAKEVFEVEDDPLANEGYGEEGDPGLWQGDSFAKWKVENSSNNWKPNPDAILNSTIVKQPTKDRKMSATSKKKVYPCDPQPNDEGSLMYASISSMDSLVEPMWSVPKLDDD